MYLQKVNATTAELMYDLYRDLGFPDDYINNLTVYAVMQDGNLALNAQGKPTLTAFSDDEVKFELSHKNYQKVITDPEIDLVSWRENHA